LVDSYSVLYRTETMDDFEKKRAGYMTLIQQSGRLAAKAAPVIAIAAVLQEAVNLNRQLAGSVAELLEAVTNERQQKSLNPDGGQVSRETRSSAS
jgi:hypothetical protein